MIAVYFNHLPNTPDWVQSIILPLLRWLHIVATATLVGGTLFYEFVIPKAIEDLKEETQLAVLGRVRWIFRGLVIFSATVLVLTGAFETWRTWPSYSGPFDTARPWWIAHVAIGLGAMAIAVLITLGNRVPRHPIAWLRVSFVIMLVAIFVAAITRHVRLSLEEDAERYNAQISIDPFVLPLDWGAHLQQPTTEPAVPQTQPSPGPAQ